MSGHFHLLRVGAFVLCLAGLSVSQDAVLSDSTAATVRPAGQWSVADTDTSPEGGVKFNGPFGNQTVSVSFGDLASHQFVRVSLDLLILRTWDGSTQLPLPEGRRDIGPDHFQAAIAGGAVLLNTTFSNYTGDPGFYPDSKYQNFPSPIPGDLLPPYSGADARQSLGYHYPNPGPPQLVPMDATYRLSFLVPHDAKSLTLDLKGSGLQNLLDESWGVSKLQVELLTEAQVTPPSDAQIAEAFATALDVQSTKQPEAFNTLVAGMNATTAWIASNVNPSGLDAQAIAEQIKNLSGDDNQMSARNEAVDRLTLSGSTVEPYLRDARLIAPGEVRARIDTILSTLGVRPITEEPVRRVMLATRVLEVIRTQAAIDLRLRLVRQVP